jgi:hypothetical protein
MISYGYGVTNVDWFWVLVNPVLIIRPANSVTCLELDQELDCATQVPARSTKLGTGSFSNLKNPHQNCTRAISVEKTEGETGTVSPLQNNRSSKDRNQRWSLKARTGSKLEN